MKYAGNIKGALVLRSGDDISELVSVGGEIWISEIGTFHAPTLVVAGSVWVNEYSTLIAPYLFKAGDIWLNQGATFQAPVLSVADCVELHTGTTLHAPVLSKAKYVTVSRGATLYAPTLANVSRILIYRGAKLDVSMLVYEITERTGVSLESADSTTALIDPSEDDVEKVAKALANEHDDTCAWEDRADVEKMAWRRSAHIAIMAMKGVGA